MSLDKDDVVMRVVNVLDNLGIAYFIGGSFASSLYGMMRTTNDADVVAGLTQEHVLAFLEALASEFYVEERSIRRAVESGRHFNLIHGETQFKVDVFTPRPKAFVSSELERREQHQFGSNHTAYFASAEDTVLAKLEWYRLGNEVSDRQWRDITEVLKVQRGRLDLEYLKHWAEALSVSDLLDEALEEADSLFAPPKHQ